MQNTDTPRRFLSHPRVAAEWEPTIGVMVSYPLNVPHTLIIALAKNHDVYMVVPSKGKKDQAIQDLKSWKVDLKKVNFIVAPHGTDMSWTRDWGPHALFDERKRMKLVDPLYLHRTPYSSISGNDPLWKSRWRKFKLQVLGRKINPDNEMPKEMGKYFDQRVLSLPFALTGGNIFMDGHGNAMSMEVLLNENRRLNKIDDDVFFDYCDSHLGLKNYAILPNFEDYGIQHIDCFLKMLDEERLLVLRPPQDHPYYERYEEIINKEIRSLTNAYGRPYQIVRLDTDRFRNDELAAYVNAIILNKHIYVPLYSIPQDQVALEQWREAMPGYTVQGFEYDLTKETAHIKKYRDIGWRDGDALHCRTRGIWDPNMLYLSVNRFDALVERQDAYRLDVFIIDYSKSGLIEETLQLRWREVGIDNWETVQLINYNDSDTYQALLAPPKTISKIEYYVTAENKAGQQETMPRTAPEGLYRFEIE